MANDAYSIVKFMRASGMEADLVLNKQDFGMALPQWEEGIFMKGINPYSVRPKDIDGTIHSLPAWIRFWDQNRFGEDAFAHALNRIDLYRLVKEYDIIEAHAPFAIYAQFLRKPYVVFDAGWVRYFPFKDSVRDKLARRGYMKGSVVLVTNPDTFWIFDRLPYVRRTIFMPFLIDTEIYRPLKTNLRSTYGSELLLFAPSRQIWHEKGNDKLLRGFASFVRDSSTEPLLVMVDWGPDAEKSKRLAVDLGLAGHVKFIDPVHKRDLVEYYNAADIVLDQFVLGSYGTAAPEAMACEKPVIMYYSEEAFMRSFGERPPLLNAFTPEEIALQLRRCQSESFRKDVGKQSREWVLRQHNWRLVVERHRKIYSYTLGECEWEDITDN